MLKARIGIGNTPTRAKKPSTTTTTTRRLLPLQGRVTANRVNLPYSHINDENADPLDGANNENADPLVGNRKAPSAPFVVHFLSTFA